MAEILRLEASLSVLFPKLERAVHTPLIYCISPEVIHNTGSGEDEPAINLAGRIIDRDKEVDPFPRVRRQREEEARNLSGSVLGTELSHAAFCNVAFRVRLGCRHGVISLRSASMCTRKCH